ncbi:GNAT family N-acetyltransferase [bacterium]|nr:GNAT family N-acetyltransferase [bacterium]
MSNSNIELEEIKFTKVENESDFPEWAKRDEVALYLHETMKPYNDKLEDVNRALDFVFRKNGGMGGFVMLTHRGENLLGICVMMKTGMKGYIPENLLLMITVDPETRGQGIGGKLIDKCARECEGDIKLHVEYDNPAKRLYERVGFTTKYAEMRYNNPYSSK